MDRDDAILDYLQKRLSPQERDQFEKTMVQDAALAAEVALMQAVRAELSTGPVHDASDAVWERVSAGMDATPVPANTNRRPWGQVMKYAAVAAIAVMAWQVAVVPRMSAVPEGFRTATQPQAVFALQVKFVEAATIGEIGVLLGTLGGTISDGPTALGLVRVSFVDQASQQRALDALSARSDLIELVVQP